MKVVLKPTAEKAIVEIANYISETIKMPETAERYTDRLLQFAHQISITPQAHALCKYPIWKSKICNVLYLIKPGFLLLN